MLDLKEDIDSSVSMNSSLSVEDSISDDTPPSKVILPKKTKDTLS